MLCDQQVAICLMLLTYQAVRANQNQCRNEYVKRAITYISTFIPEGKRNEMELLDFLYQLTDRDDVKEYRCELIAQAMTRE